MSDADESEGLRDKPLGEKSLRGEVTRSEAVETPTDAPHLNVDAPSPQVLTLREQRLVGGASPPWGITTKAIIASAILIVGALVLWRFQFLLSPLVLAAVLAYLLNPLIGWLSRKTEVTRPQAVLIIYALVLVILGTGGFFLGVVVAQQSVVLWQALPEFLPRLVDTVQVRAQDWANVSWTLGPYSFEPGAIFDLIDWESLTASIVSSVRTFLGRSGLWLAGVAGATLGTLSDTLFVLIVSIYLAIDGPRFGRGISELAQQPGYRRDTERLMSDSIKIWDAYLRGQVILGIVIFVLVSIALSILGVNNALELGILSGLLEFLPIIGPFIGTGAAVLVALMQDSNAWGVSPWLFALIVLGVMFLIQQVENAILVPRIVGDALDLHALVVLIGVLMGTSLAGLLGAVLAAPVIATLKLFGTYVWRKMLDLPPFVDTLPDDDTSTGENPGGGTLAWLTEWFRTRATRP